MNQVTNLPAPGSHFIPLSRGIEMTTLYRSQKESMLAPPFQNKGALPICETFNRFDIDTLLAKPGCEALRVYLGMDELQRVRIVLVAVNKNAEDMLPLPSAIGPMLSTEEDIVEEGHRCPDSCPPPSPLNS